MVLLIAFLAVIPLGALGDITCPDSSKCPDNSTCCAWSNVAGFGCCPVLSGVCCKKDYCCDVGDICENHLGICVNTLLSNKGRLAFRDSSKGKLKDIPCSGSSTGSCPDNDTCCQAGCCPMPNAVCCSDDEHCCPQNTICDVSAGLCIGSHIKIKNVGEILQTETLKTALAVGEKVVYCPGGQYYCPDYNTCCQLPTGQWGCCPYPSAVCCPDKVHCCPAGTRCGPTSTQCLTSESRIITARQKFLARLLGKH